MTTALIIIDVQNDILEGACLEARKEEVGHHFDGVVARLTGLRDRARAAGTPVVIIQHDDQPGEPLAPGSPGWDVVAPLRPAGSDILVHKASCDAFFETDLLGHLEERGITNLVVGGCLTQYCVDTTVRRAVSLGFDVTLVADGHTTGDSGALSQSEVVAHHNATLDGFCAGKAEVQVLPAAAIAF